MLPGSGKLLECDYEASVSHMVSFRQKVQTDKVHAISTAL